MRIFDNDIVKLDMNTFSYFNTYTGIPAQTNSCEDHLLARIRMYEEAYSLLEEAYNGLQERCEFLEERCEFLEAYAESNNQRILRLEEVVDHN